jgi:hypothetical protein
VRADLVREPLGEKDDRRNVLHADKPEHLAKYIAAAEAEVGR